MSNGTIKLTIDTNGAIKTEMDNFKNCSQKTEELFKAMDVQSNDINTKEEEVQTVSSSNVNVKS